MGNTKPSGVTRVCEESSAELKTTDDTSFYNFCRQIRPTIALVLAAIAKYNGPLATAYKCSDYFVKFSLSTHTDVQNLYFGNFFYDKYTCSKSSILDFEQVYLS